MKNSVVKYLGILGAVATGAMLVGCSGEGLPSDVQAVRTDLEGPESTIAVSPTKSRPLLYVGNYVPNASNVLVFADSGKTLKRTISLPNPIATGVAVNARGNLFAASGNDTSVQSITVFASKSYRTVKSLKQQYAPEALTVDPLGDLFASCGQAASAVCEYGATKRGVVASRVTRQINVEAYGLRSAALTTDASGDLPVSDQNHVTLFAPGSTTPYLDMALAQWEIGTGGVTFDGSGNLYVAWTGYYERNGISEYAPGSSDKPIRTFYVYNDETQAASVLRFDGAGNLYALFQSNGNTQLDVFAPNETKPARAITAGLENFTGYLSMAVDSGGDIFVANDGSQNTEGSIAFYVSGHAKPERMITSGIDHPGYLALSSSE